MARAAIRTELKDGDSMTRTRSCIVELRQASSLAARPAICIQLRLKRTSFASLMREAR